MHYYLLAALLLEGFCPSGAQLIALAEPPVGAPSCPRPTGGLAKGTAAPAFRLQDAAGKAVSLSDFLGKVVYLDFWGSWCKPCMAEMPAAAALKKQFLGREVVFVYIAQETYVEGWKQTIEHNALASSNSVHLLDPDGLRAVHAYHVESFPTYVILDRQGRVWSGNAPRPSGGKQTVKALNHALAAK